MLLHCIIVVNDGNFIMYFIIIKMCRYGWHSCSHSHLVCFFSFHFIITLLLSSMLRAIYFQSITEIFTDLNNRKLCLHFSVCMHMFLNRVFYRRQVFIFAVGVLCWLGINATATINGLLIYINGYISWCISDNNKFIISLLLHNPTYVFWWNL